MFCHRIMWVRRGDWIVSGMRRRSSFMMTKSVASIAVSVAAPPMVEAMSD